MSLAISVVANIIHDAAVSHEITLLLFGCLVAIGVGNVVVNPSTSRVILSERDEAKFRRRQYIAGFVFSGFLVLILAFTELRGTVLVWLFAPIIALPFGLVIREYLTKH